MKITSKQKDRIIQLYKMGMWNIHIAECVYPEGTDVSPQYIANLVHREHVTKIGGRLTKEQSDLLKKQQMERFMHMQAEKLREAGFKVKDYEPDLTPADIQKKAYIDESPLSHEANVRSDLAVYIEKNADVIAGLFVEMVKAVKQA